MARVLCTGADPLLMMTRKMILEKAGHRVITAASAREIVDACSRTMFDVSILGQALSEDEKRCYASLIREHSPSTKVLELYTSGQMRAVEDADDWLEVPVRVPPQFAERVSHLAANAATAS